MRIKLVYLLMFGILCILSMPAMAAVFTMTGGDAGNNSSFYNTGGSYLWSPAGAPVSSGDPVNNPNIYYTCGYLMRSPATGSGYLTGDYTFAGDKLVIGYSPTGTLANAFTAGYAVNDSLIFKQNQQTLTVNNLVLDAGVVRDGLGADIDTWGLAGNLYITANGGAFAEQSKGVISAVISGPGPLYVGDNGNNYTDATHRGLYISSPLNTYAGNIIMNSGTTTAGRSQLCFTSGSVMNFNIGANGVNNSISGIGMLTANGTFNINVSGADTTLGNLWTLIASTVVPPTTNIPTGEATGMLAMYEGNGHFTGSTAGGNMAYTGYGSNATGDTFNIAGFTKEYSGFWAQAIPSSPNYFVFNENDGTLRVLNTVPEPATCIMLVLAAMGIAFYSRKK
jgi:hypothetical protein